jgi:hypothetical protein
MEAALCSKLRETFTELYSVTPVTPLTTVIILVAAMGNSDLSKHLLYDENIC